MTDTAVKKPNALALREHIDRWTPSIARALPDPSIVDKFIAAYWSATRFVPKLLTCSRESTIDALLACADLNLLPSPGFRYIHLLPIESRKRGTTEIQVVIGFRGMLELTMRSNRVRSVNVQAVYEFDYFEANLGEPRIEHHPALGKRGALIGAWSKLELRDGGINATYMGAEEIYAIRDQHARAWEDRSSPWQLHTAEMFKKTVLRRLLKTCPLGGDLDAKVERHDGKVPRSPSPVVDQDGQVLEALTGGHEQVAVNKMENGTDGPPAQ